MYEHMSTEQLGNYVEIAGHEVLCARSDGKGIEQAQQAYAEALNAYRLRSN